ncbi:serine hydrolase domain-containing protein [Paenibacillus amylolyticus]|uniref:serine hydrolase domain-containing protein n=1 Tax=Paenibacillus amylolyticus TaxID=1451 RepID=UPI0039AFC08B
MDLQQIDIIRQNMHFAHRFLPTATVHRSGGDVSPIASEPLHLDELAFVDATGRATTLSQALERTHTDAFLVMHRGKIVYEKYYSGMEPTLRHGLASVTKSFIGTLISIELFVGNLGANDRVDRYIPELADSAFGDATIQQLLDMQISCKYPIFFPEANYIDNQRNLLLTAIGTIPAKEGYTGPKTIHEYLASITKSQEHGSAFLYSNGPTEVLGWILGRVNDTSLAELLSQRIWSKLGTEEDAYFVVDSVGTEQACGGLHATLRDVARFAEMMRNDGLFNGYRIVPKAVIGDIQQGGRRDLLAASNRAKARPGYSYRNQWWITHNRFKAYEANGLYGQRIHIAPLAEMVIVQFSSYPGHSDETARLFSHGFEAIANHLN